MVKNIIIFAGLCIFFLAPHKAFSGKLPSGHKDCSWGCKSIPPLSESHIQYGASNNVALPSKNLKVFEYILYVFIVLNIISAVSITIQFITRPALFLHYQIK